MVAINGVRRNLMNYYDRVLKVVKNTHLDEILNLILQSSAEGAYFTRDIMNNFLTSDCVSNFF